MTAIPGAAASSSKTTSPSRTARSDVLNSLARFRKKIPPSRDKVSAAIALVRARQKAAGSPRAASNRVQPPPLTTEVPPALPPPSVYRSSLSRSEAGNLMVMKPTFEENAEKEKESVKKEGQSMPIITTTGSATGPTSPATPQSASTGRSPTHSMRSPLTPKSNAAEEDNTMVSKRQPSEPQKVRQPQQASASQPSSPAGFFMNVFASRQAVAPTSPALASSTADQENNIPTRQGENPASIHPTLSSTSSDEDCSVDVDTLADVSRFIDALHQQKSSAPVEPPKQRELTDLPSSSTESDETPVSATALEGIGQFIDSIAKPQTQTQPALPEPAVSENPSQDEILGARSPTQQKEKLTSEDGKDPDEELIVHDDQVVEGASFKGGAQDKNIREEEEGQVGAIMTMEHEAIEIQANNNNNNKLQVTPEGVDVVPILPVGQQLEAQPGPTEAVKTEQAKSSSKEGIPGPVSSESSDEHDISPETMAGIVAFIDSLQKETSPSPSPSPPQPQTYSSARPPPPPPPYPVQRQARAFEQPEILYVSSSDESYYDDLEEDFQFETEEQLSAYISSIKFPENGTDRANPATVGDESQLVGANIHTDDDIDDIMAREMDSRLDAALAERDEEELNKEDRDWDKDRNLPGGGHRYGSTEELEIEGRVGGDPAADHQAVADYSGELDQGQEDHGDAVNIQVKLYGGKSDVVDDTYGSAMDLQQNEKEEQVNRGQEGTVVSLEECEPEMTESPTLVMMASSDSGTYEDIDNMLIADLSGAHSDLDGESLLEYALDSRLSEISGIQSEEPREEEKTDDTHHETVEEEEESTGANGWVSDPEAKGQSGTSAEEDCEGVVEDKTKVNINSESSRSSLRTANDRKDDEEDLMNPWGMDPEVEGTLFESPREDEELWNKEVCEGISFEVGLDGNLLDGSDGPSVDGLVQESTVKAANSDDNLDKALQDALENGSDDDDETSEADPEAERLIQAFLSGSTSDLDDAYEDDAEARAGQYAGTELDAHSDRAGSSFQQLPSLDLATQVGKPPSAEPSSGKVGTSAVTGRPGLAVSTDQSRAVETPTPNMDGNRVSTFTDRDDLVANLADELSTSNWSKETGVSAGIELDVRGTQIGNPSGCSQSPADGPSGAAKLDEQSQLSAHNSSRGRQVDYPLSAPRRAEVGSPMEQPLSPEPIIRPFSSMNSVDENEHIESFLGKMTIQRDDFFPKVTPPERASEDEIEKLNTFIRVAGPLLNGKEITILEEAEIRKTARAVDMSDEALDGILQIKNGAFVKKEQKKKSSTKAPKQAQATMKAILSKLSFSENVSQEDIETVHEFLWAAASVLANGSIPLAEEAQLRRKGINMRITDEILDQIFSTHHKVVSAIEKTISPSSSQDTRDLRGKLDEVDLDVDHGDDDDQIEAFMQRMAALKEGGHMGGVNPLNTSTANEENVEIDANVGFVNKSLQACSTEEDDLPWWQQDDAVISESHRAIQINETDSDEFFSLQHETNKVVEIDETESEELPNQDEIKEGTAMNVVKSEQTLQNEQDNRSLEMEDGTTEDNLEQYKSQDIDLVRARKTHAGEVKSTETKQELRSESDVEGHHPVRAETPFSTKSPRVSPVMKSPSQLTPGGKSLAFPSPSPTSRSPPPSRANMEGGVDPSFSPCGPSSFSVASSKPSLVVKATQYAVSPVQATARSGSGVSSQEPSRHLSVKASGPSASPRRSPANTLSYRHHQSPKVAEPPVVSSQTAAHSESNVSSREESKLPAYSDSSTNLGNLNSPLPTAQTPVHSDSSTIPSRTHSSVSATKSSPLSPTVTSPAPKRKLLPFISDGSGRTFSQDDNEAHLDSVAPADQPKAGAPSANASSTKSTDVDSSTRNRAASKKRNKKTRALGGAAAAAATTIAAKKKEGDYVELREKERPKLPSSSLSSRQKKEHGEQAVVKRQSYDLGRVKRQSYELGQYGFESTLSLPVMSMPFMFNDFETMFEDRQDRIIRVRRAKLSKWKNPWGRRWCSDEEQPTSVNLSISSGTNSKISCVAAMRRLNRWRSHNKDHKPAMPITQLWRGTYKDRTKRHTGYFEADIYSIYDTSVVVAEPHELDSENWEDRDVRQNFLHDQSITFCRNWFGVLLKKRGNDRQKLPVAEPKSMEMPMDLLPNDGDWDEEWYATWQRRRDPAFRKMIQQQAEKRPVGRNRRDYDDYSESEYSESVYSHSAYSHSAYSQSVYSQSAYSQSAYSQSVYSNYTDRCTRSGGDEDDDEEEYDDTWGEYRPECGILQNTKLKIGDRVSRITPDLTSSLRRSRWRKKYFPRGTFPYK